MFLSPMNSRKESNLIQFSPKRFFYKRLLSFVSEFDTIEFGVSDPSVDTDELLSCYTLYYIKFNLELSHSMLT
jgi:hypothetical protein